MGVLEVDVSSWHEKETLAMFSSVFSIQMDICFLSEPLRDVPIDTLRALGPVSLPTAFPFGVLFERSRLARLLSEHPAFPCYSLPLHQVGGDQL